LKQLDSAIRKIIIIVVIAKLTFLLKMPLKILNFPAHLKNPLKYLTNALIAAQTIFEKKWLHGADHVAIYR